MTSIVKMIGLNKPWKAGGFTGYYATISFGKEDWFHSGFDETKISFDRQKALFNLFKNSEDNLWHDKNHQVKIEFDEISKSLKPIQPKIIEIILDDL